jgi:hypothetical protein
MKQFFSLVLFATIIALSSCSIEKRVYQSGYYISGRHAANDDLNATKRVKPVIVEDAQNLKTTSEEVVVATEKFTTSAKPLVSSDSTIEESITSNIHQTNKILTEINADSIPDEGKILLAKYEKNLASKNKIGEITIYLIVLFLIVFFAFLLLIIPWLLYVIYDSIMIALFRICAAVMAIVIPFAISHLVLSIIIKKQRLKLRLMGLVK